MLSIHKYPLAFGHWNIFCDPSAKFLHFGFQNGEPMIWLEEGTYQQSCSFEILPTGAQVPHGFKHLASAIDGPFVWHLYTLNRNFK